MVSAETILIATGGTPSFPPGPGWEHAVSSNECFHLERLPERVVVYGGGYIAVEFAGIFNGLGSQVTQVYRGPRVLRGFDEDVRATLSEEMAKKGIAFAFERTIDAIEKRPTAASALTLSDGSRLGLRPLDGGHRAPAQHRRPGPGGGRGRARRRRARSRWTPSPEPASPTSTPWATSPTASP